MNPKKPKDFIKPTAEDLGQSEQLVDDVVGFYWAAVKKGLSELESPSVVVINLGTFKIRHNKIEKAEKRYKNYINKLEVEKMTFNKHTLLNISKSKLEKLENIKNEMNSEFERKKEVQTKRKEYVNNKTLEKQRKDFRRSEE